MADTTPSPCGTIPSIAQAYSFNITAIPKTAGGIAFVTVWPAGSPQPGVSTINDGQGQILANAAIVPAGTPFGGVNVLNSGPATMDLTIDMNGFYAAPTDLVGDTAIGSGALVSNTSGVDNTATGFFALQQNTTGDFNVATGVNALQTNNGGSYNTATGVQALEYNTSGPWNTAVGYNSLQANTTGGSNTAVGYEALGISTTGSGSTAVGFGALEYSTAAGAPAGNTAVGYVALQGSSNTSANTGTLNTAVGYQALHQNTAGSNNTAVGISALSNNTTGAYNIAIGVNAGINVGTGSGICAESACNYNIDIGNPGQVGDSGTIRIGDPNTPDQGPTYITGIFTETIFGGTPVVVNSNGGLAVAGSSRRYKEDIQDMGDASRGLMDLRPVTFRYKKAAEDGSKPLQYGLIAEEVEEVYPDLVVHLKDGRAHTVQYQMLPAMLLNEVQKQYQHAQQQDETIRQQQAQILQQQEQNRKLEARLAALEGLLSGKAPATATAGR
jgi:hypothetical protein